MYGVTIAELIEKMDFKNLELDSEKIVVSHPDVNRPALQLTGFYAHFDNERVQMIGNVEIAYLSGLSRERRIAMYDKLISSKIPCLVFCRNQIRRLQNSATTTVFHVFSPRNRHPTRWRRSSAG